MHLAEVLRGALNIDPCLPLRCTLEEACYRLSSSGKVDKTAFLLDRARQCVEVVRAIQEKTAAAGAAATSNKAKAGAKPKSAAKAKPAAAKAKSAGAMPAATKHNTKVRHL